MINVNDFKTGVSVEIDGDAYVVVEFQHVKPGKGSAFVRTKLRNTRTGAVVEQTFNAGVKLPKAHLDHREMQYLYNDGEFYVVMDVENYEQLSLTAEQVGDSVKYLKEGLEVTALSHKGEIINIELPITVEAEVIEKSGGFWVIRCGGGKRDAV